METESTDPKEVAEPDAVVSGTARTGQENKEPGWMRRHVPPYPFHAERRSIGREVRTRHTVRKNRSGKEREYV